MNEGARGRGNKEAILCFGVVAAILSLLAASSTYVRGSDEVTRSASG